LSWALNAKNVGGLPTLPFVKDEHLKEAFFMDAMQMKWNLEIQLLVYGDRFDDR
jgi:hypothetical protein